MTECIFCKIARNEIPSYRLYENENFIVMLTIYPYLDGHTLVIPKQHYPKVWDLPEDLYQEYMGITKKVANLLKERTGSNHVYSFVAGNEIDHAHIHVVPSNELSFSEMMNTKPSEMITEEKAKELVEKLKLD